MHFDTRGNGRLDDEVAGNGPMEQVPPRHLHLMVVCGDDEDGLPLLGDGLVDGRDGAVVDAPFRERCAPEGPGGGNPHGETGKAHGQ